jgi:hypothetical protein
MCAWPGVDWDLVSIVQKKGESLQEYMQHFCNKRNVISEVDDKTIVMFFKKGLRDSSPIWNLAMKNHRTSEVMFSIANRYALAEEATLDTREQKESGQPDQPSSSKDHNKKRKPDRSVNVVEWPHCHNEYRPRSGEFEGFLDRICIILPLEKAQHPILRPTPRFCRWYSQDGQGGQSREEARGSKGQHPRGSQRGQLHFWWPRLIWAQEEAKTHSLGGDAIKPANPKYLRWSEVPITFDHNDHLDFIPKPGWYPLVIYPIVKDVKLNRVLVDGGSSLTLHFLKTFDQMALSRSLLHTSRAPFHGIVPGAAAMPIGQISLLVTFGTRENFQTRTIQFEVTNFKIAYNAFLGWPALTKFIAILHYAYLVLKMKGPHGVISIRGDVKRAYDYDKETCEIADKLATSTKLQELKEALAESPLDPVMPDSGNSI